MSMRTSNVNTDWVVGYAHRVSIPTTSGGVTLLSLATAYDATFTAFPADTIRIGLVREYNTAGLIHFDLEGDAPTTSSPQWPSGEIASMPVTKATATAIKVISSSGTIAATLLVMVPRVRPDAA
jgi:hypothetical protein